MLGHAANADWPWLVLVGLGAFHGINPAMGWLFATALGLYRDSRGVVLAALLPIAVGHAVSVAIVASLALAAGVVVDRRLIQVAGGAVLIGWAIYHTFARHRVRFGMKVGYLGLMGWSFLMATSHGAGLMLIPVLVPMQAAAHPVHAATVGGSFLLAFAAVGVHSIAMLVTTGLVALVVYEFVGIAILRRGWINLDRLWTLALVAAGLILLALACLGS